MLRTFYAFLSLCLFSSVLAQEPLIISSDINDFVSAPNKSVARTRLGLGTAATKSTGTANGNVVMLDATGLPAVDGSQLTGGVDVTPALGQAAIDALPSPSLGDTVYNTDREQRQLRSRYGDGTVYWQDLLTNSYYSRDLKYPFSDPDNVTTLQWVFDQSSNDMDIGYNNNTALSLLARASNGVTSLDQEGKTTFGVFSTSLVANAQGQRVSQNHLVTSYGAGDAILANNTIEMYGELNASGDEGTKIWRNTLVQGRNINNQTIASSDKSNINTTVTSGAITGNQDVQTVTVGAIGDLVVGDWIIVDHASRETAAFSKSEAVKITAISGSDITGRFTHSHDAGVSILGATVLTMNAAAAYGQGMYAVNTGADFASGTAQAGGASTIQLAVGSSASDDAYNGMVVWIYSGTGLNQYGKITDYVGATTTATVSPAWVVQPDATSLYRIISGTNVHIGTGSIAGTQVTSDQSNLTANMVGGDSTNPGALSWALDNRINQSGAFPVYTPMRAWYPTYDLSSTTAIKLWRRLAQGGPVGYDGDAVGASNAYFMIRPAARILAFDPPETVSPQVLVLDYNTFTWTAGDTVESAHGTSNDVSGGTTSVIWYMPGQELRAAHQYYNDGPEPWATGIDIDSPGTGGGFATGVYSKANEYAFSGVLPSNGSILRGVNNTSGAYFNIDITGTDVNFTATNPATAVHLVGPVVRVRNGSGADIRQTGTDNRMRSDNLIGWSWTTDNSWDMDVAFKRLDGGGGAGDGRIQVLEGTGLAAPTDLGSMVMKDIELNPSASLTPADNGELVIEATNNTTLTFKYKGSDGTVRSGTLTLAP